jgi:preprotein translocase subunit YajC
MISLAFAQAAGASDTASTLSQFLPLVFMFGVIWFIMIRPQMKKAKDHKAMVEALAKGDEVVLQAGITGRITKIGDNYLHVEIAEGVEVTIQKLAVGQLLPKGTLKTM